MPNPKKRPPAEPATFVIDSNYFRAQAKEALSLFVAPLSGVFAAARGPAADAPEQTAAKRKQRA